MTNPLLHNLQRAKTIITLFYAVILIYLISIVSLWMQINMLNHFDVANLDMEDVRANDLRQIIVTVTIVVILVVTTIFFIMWFRRAYYNLQNAGQFTEFTEGWAAGSWFVPFLNLVRPYKIMVEIWEKTQNAVPHFIGKRSSQIVGLWWAGHIISNIFSNMAYRMGDDKSGIDELISASWVQIISNFLRIGAAVLSILMIQQASEMEEALYNNIANAHSEEEGQHILGFVGNA